MEEDLKQLEEKLANLLSLYHSLRIENIQLKQDLSATQADLTTLKINMEEASSRIEALMGHLP